MRSPFSARSFADRAAARETAPAPARPTGEAGMTGEAAGSVETGDRGAAARAPDGPTDAAAPRRDAAQGAATGAEASAGTPAARPAPRPAPAPAPSPAVRGDSRGGGAPGPVAPRPVAARPVASRPVASRPASPARPAAALDAGGPALLPIQALGTGGRWRVEALHSYRAPVLYWFTRGQGRLTLSGATRGYGTHNAVFVPARAMHAFELTPQIYGTAVFFAGLDEIALPDGPLHLRVREAAAQTEVTTLLEGLSREIDGSRAHRDRAIRLQAGLLAIWLDRHRDLAAPQAAATAAQRLAARFAEAVEANLHTGQGVADYAEALGVTATHLSRVCRESCGRTASDILAERTMVEARRLLAETGLPVKQVAEMLGFGSAAYFTRAFQTRIGQTPTQFRRAA